MKLTALKKKQLVDKAKSELLQQVNNSERESAHAIADNALCELLNGLGFTDVVEIYNKVGKWYA